MPTINNIQPFSTRFSLMMKVGLSKRLIKIKYGNVFFSIGSFIHYNAHNLTRKRKSLCLSAQTVPDWNFFFKAPKLFLKWKREFPLSD